MKNNDMTKSFEYAFAVAEYYINISSNHLKNQCGERVATVFKIYIFFNPLDLHDLLIFCSGGIKYQVAKFGTSLRVIFISRKFRVKPIRCVTDLHLGK